MVKKLKAIRTPRLLLQDSLREQAFAQYVIVNI
jgi:hypothetical protein